MILRAEFIAREFHEAYERLAPAFGYETRPESAVPWRDVPSPNRELMVAAAGAVLDVVLAAERERVTRIIRDARDEYAAEIGAEGEVAACTSLLEVLVNPLGDHPHHDPGDGRAQCDVCGKWVWLVTHSCKGIRVAPRVSQPVSRESA